MFSIDPLTELMCIVDWINNNPNSCLIEAGKQRVKLILKYEKGQFLRMKPCIDEQGVYYCSIATAARCNRINYKSLSRDVIMGGKKYGIRLI